MRKVLFAQGAYKSGLGRVCLRGPDYDLMIRCIPVSYTHLDVYKRQTQALASKATDTAMAGRSGRRTGPAAWTSTSSDSARWWWLSVRDRDLGTPPASPVDRHRYVIPAAATGVWSGRAGQIAVRIVSPWEFHVPLSLIHI